jgi:hypothetical protein
MRFHWGLAVGHVYTHQQLCTNAGVIWRDTNQRFRSGDVPGEAVEPTDQMVPEDDPDSLRETSDTDSGHFNIGSGSGTDGSGSESDDEDYEPSDGDDDQSSDSDEDEHWLDMDEMYGPEDSDDDLYEG